MNAAVSVANFGLGVAYLGVGLIVLADMKRGWKRYGFSHFGAAMVALAFTCGPHHLFHGIHVAFEGRPGGVLDAVSVAAGLPVAAIWLTLRIEAFEGGAGDRFIAGTPRWLGVMPTVSAVYLTAIVGAAVQVRGPGGVAGTVLPNLILIAVYLAIGGTLLRAQLAGHRRTGGWSVSGLTFMAIFPTCAVMHAMWAVYGLTGRYEFDIHGYVVDWISVPAGLYFLAVTRALSRESLRDWNAPRPAAEPVRVS